MSDQPYTIGNSETRVLPVFATRNNDREREVYVEKDDLDTDEAKVRRNRRNFLPSPSEYSDQPQWYYSRYAMEGPRREQVYDCLVENKVIKDQGWWLYNHNRGWRDGDDIELFNSVEKTRNVAVPRKCVNSEVNIANGVKTTRVKDPITGEVRLEVTPQTTKIILHSGLQKEKQEYPGALEYSSDRKGGNDDVRMPSNKLARENFNRLTQKDIESIYLSPPNGWTRSSKDPQSRAENPQFYNQVSQVRIDPSGYGVSDAAFHSMGINFPQRYWNRSFFEDKDASISKYFNWLVTVIMRFNSAFPEVSNYSYLPAFDSIATLESWILTICGILERITDGKYNCQHIIQRFVLFEGWEKVKDELHKYIKGYAEAPKQTIHGSKINARYISFDKEFTNFRDATKDTNFDYKLYRPKEALALEYVQDLLDEFIIITDKASDKNPANYALLNSFARRIKMVGPDYFTMAWREDGLLTLLCYMQMTDSIVLNIPAFEKESDDKHPDAATKTYFVSTFIQYIDRFDFSTTEVADEFFVQLPALRRKQIVEIARERNMRLPNNGIRESLEKEGFRKPFNIEDKDENMVRHYSGYPARFGNPPFSRGEPYIRGAMVGGFPVQPPQNQKQLIQSQIKPHKKITLKHKSHKSRSVQSL